MSGRLDEATPVGAGRGKDDEATFGHDVSTAPQVIGDDEFED